MHSTTKNRQRKVGYPLRFEQCEPRQMLAAAPELLAAEPPLYDDEGTLRSNAIKEERSARNLGQLAHAILSYESVHRRLPAHAIYSANGSQPLLSWRVEILPYLGHVKLYNQFRLDESWDSPHNRSLLPQMPAVYLNPNAPRPILTAGPVTETTYQVMVGDGTAFPQVENGLRIGQIRDGLSNTVLVVETDADRAVPWTQPVDLGFDAADPLDGLGQITSVGFNTVVASAETFEVPSNVDLQLWTNLVLRDDGQFVDLNQIAPPLQPADALRSLGLAALNFESAFRNLPARAIVDDAGQPLLSWRVSLLPFVDQLNLYNQFRLDEPWDSPHNSLLIPMMPRVFRHELVPIGQTNYLVFAGEDTVFPEPDERGNGVANLPDPRSGTILFAEADAEIAVAWTRPQDIDYDSADPLNGVGGDDESFDVVFADGHVEAIPSSISPEDFNQMVLRNDGGLQNGEFYAWIDEVRLTKSDVQCVDPQPSRATIDLGSYGLAVVDWGLRFREADSERELDRHNELFASVEQI